MVCPFTPPTLPHHHYQMEIFANWSTGRIGWPLGEKERKNAIVPCYSDRVKIKKQGRKITLTQSTDNKMKME